MSESFSPPNGMTLLFLQEWNISRLSYEYDSEPFGKERDAAIRKLANEAGVEVIVRISHTLYDLDKYVLHLISSLTETITYCQFFLPV